MKTGNATHLPNGRIAVEHRCPHCGYEWLEYSDSDNYPEHCPLCGASLPEEPPHEKPRATTSKAAIGYYCHNCWHEWTEPVDADARSISCPACGKHLTNEVPDTTVRTMLVPFGKYKLRILTPVDPNHPGEVNVDIVDENGVLVQDICWIQPGLYDTDAVTVKLYGRPNDEDWTSEFTIPIRR